MLKTALNKPWLIKTMLVMIGLTAFGLYGLYDAALAYPTRGAQSAEYYEWQYLIASDREGRVALRDAGVEDPSAEMARLSESLDTLRREAQSADNPIGQLSALAKISRYDWLRALSLIGKATSDNTTFVEQEPAARLASLNAAWSNRNPPKPLNGYDIPVQWAFTVVGLGIGGWLLILIIRVKATVFRYDPEARRLTLPGGATISPSDLEDVDKRKWDKYLVFLKIKPGHEKLGGSEVKLDLYRHAPLEAWVLEMERAAFPDRAEDQTPTPDPVDRGVQDAEPESEQEPAGAEGTSP